MSTNTDVLRVALEQTLAFNKLCVDLFTKALATNKVDPQALLNVLREEPVVRALAEAALEALAPAEGSLSPAIPTESNVALAREIVQKLHPKGLKPGAWYSEIAQLIAAHVAAQIQQAMELARAEMKERCLKAENLFEPYDEQTTDYQIGWNDKEVAIASLPLI